VPNRSSPRLKSRSDASRPRQRRGPHLHAPRGEILGETGGRVDRLLLGAPIRSRPAELGKESERETKKQRQSRGEEADASRRLGRRDFVREGRSTSLEREEKWQCRECCGAVGYRTGSRTLRGTTVTLPAAMRARLLFHAPARAIQLRAAGGDTPGTCFRPRPDRGAKRKPCAAPPVAARHFNLPACNGLRGSRPSASGPSPSERIWKVVMAR
jgi:hypothetical protein